MMLEEECVCKKGLYTRLATSSIAIIQSEKEKLHRLKTG